MSRIAVAGAGISGLTVAHTLARRGHEVVLFEASARAGGKLQSDVERGFLCEWGPQSYLPRDPAIVELVHELGLDGELIGARAAAKRRWVYADKQLMPVPGSPRELLTTHLLPLVDKLRLLGDLLLPRGPASRGEDESVAAFARRRFGRRAAERIIYPLVSGLYAADPERISLPAAFPFLADWEARDRSLIVGAARALPAARKAARGLVSFASGMETLPRALARELGPALHLHAEVRDVARVGDGFQLAVRERGQYVTVAADAVVMATPASETATAVERVAADACAPLREIPYVPVTLVYAAWPTAALGRALDGYGFLTAPGEDLRMLGAVFSSAVFAQRAPAGQTLISARLGGALAPELAARPDDELTALITAELSRLLDARAAPSFIKILRQPRALPQYTLTHGARLAAVEAAERRLPGLCFTGAGLRGAGVPACVADAVVTAHKVQHHLDHLHGAHA